MMARINLESIYIEGVENVGQIIENIKKLNLDILKIDLDDHNLKNKIEGYTNILYDSMSPDGQMFYNDYDGRHSAVFYILDSLIDYKKIKQYSTGFNFCVRVKYDMKMHLDLLNTPYKYSNLIDNLYDYNFYNSVDMTGGYYHKYSKYVIKNNNN